MDKTVKQTKIEIFFSFYINYYSDSNSKMSTNLSDVFIAFEKTRYFPLIRMEKFLDDLVNDGMCFIDNHDIGFVVNPLNIKLETIEYVFGRSDIKCTFIGRKFVNIKRKGKYLDSERLHEITMIFVA